MSVHKVVDDPDFEDSRLLDGSPDYDTVSLQWEESPSNDGSIDFDEGGPQPKEKDQ